MADSPGPRENCFQGHWCGLVSKWCLTLLWPRGLSPIRLLCPWDLPGENTGAGCLVLLQEILPTQGLNPGLLHWQSLPRCSQYPIDADLFPQRESIVGHRLAPKILCRHLEKAGEKLTLSYFGATKASATVPTWWVNFAFLGSPGLGEIWMGRGECITF